MENRSEENYLLFRIHISARFGRRTVLIFKNRNDTLALLIHTPYDYAGSHTPEANYH